MLGRSDESTLMLEVLLLLLSVAATLFLALHALLLNAGIKTTDEHFGFTAALLLLYFIIQRWFQDERLEYRAFGLDN